MIPTSPRLSQKIETIAMISLFPILTLGGEAAAQTNEPIVLDAIVLHAEGSGVSGFDGYVAADSQSATKTATPLIETPRSVEVVGRDEMEQRDASTVVEALRYSSGIATGLSGLDPRFDQYKLRGFSGTISADFRDGMRQVPGSYGTFRTDLWALERVDVVKGADSAMYGQMTPAGLINRISKRPTGQRIRNFTSRVTNHGGAQAGFDIGDLLSADGDLSYRLVGLARGGEGDFEIADKRLLLEPSLTWRITDSTHLTVYGQIQKDETDANIAALNRDGNAFPIRASDPGYDYQKLDQYQIGYELEHRFAPRVILVHKLRYGDGTINARYLTGGVAGGGWQTDAEGIDYYARGRFALGNEFDYLSSDNYLRAEFRTGAMSHQALFGLDYTRANDLYRTGNAAAEAQYSLYPSHPDYGRSGATPHYTTGRKTQMTQIGVYAQNVMSLGNWRGQIGVRRDRVERDVRDTVANQRAISQSDSANSFNVGLLYAFDSGVSIYGSYSTSFQPATQIDQRGNPLQPVRGKQFEVGVKYQPEGSDALLTLAAYHLKEQNAAKYAGFDPAVGSYYDAVGEIVSKGVEAQARTNLGNGFSLIASYAWNRAEITEDLVATNIGNEPAQTPKNIASLWLNYEVQDGPLSGLSLGGGLRHNGKNYAGKDNLLVNDAFTRVDLAAHYSFGHADPRYAGLGASVNITNVANKRETVCATGYCYLGEARTISASLRYSF